MHIDSARELKSNCFRKYLAALSAVPRSTSLSLGGAGAHEKKVASIALGLSRSPDANFRLAVRLQHESPQLRQFIDRIVQEARGEADVRLVGPVVKRGWTLVPQRPLLPGVSVSHYSVTAGTLGGFVKRRADGAARLLSNNHVLANENSAAVGDAILQPGKLDGGAAPANTVGTLDAFVPLTAAGVNYVDAAIATLAPAIQFEAPTLTGLGKLAGVGAPPVDGDLVSKVGRSTNVTQGRVTAFEMDNVVVGYDLGNVRFDDQIEIEGAGADTFSDGGDSGALIVNQQLQAVGLLFAGGAYGGTNGQGLTYANAIGRVFDALAVDLLY